MKLTTKEELSLKFMIANEDNSSEGILKATFTDEVRDSLVKHGLIEFHGLSQLFYITEKGQKMIEKKMTVVHVYPLASDNGTAKSFEQTFKNASTPFLNKMMDALIASDCLKRMSNTDFVLKNLVFATSSNLSAAMLNKLYAHFSTLMEEKRKKLPKKVQLSVLNKTIKTAQDELHKLIDPILEELSGVFNLVIKKSAEGDVLFLNVEKTETVRSGKFATFFTFLVGGVQKIFELHDVPLEYKVLIAENVSC